MHNENVNKPAKSENLTKDELQSAVGGNRRSIKVPGEITIDKVRGKVTPGSQDPARKPTRS